MISKSASAELNADFTGGIVDILLKDFSALPEYSFSVSGSFNPEMNFNSNFIGNEKSAFNSLGFDNGYFDRPLASNQPIPDVETFNLSQTNLTMSLTNMFQKTMSVSRFDSFLDSSIGATASNQYNISDEKTIGFIAALGYKRDYEYYEAVSYTHLTLPTNA